MLLTAKFVAIFFAIATTAFCISTIVLAIEKSNLEDELQEALDKLDLKDTTTTTTTIATPPTEGGTPPTDPTQSPPATTTTPSGLPTTPGSSTPLPPWGSPTPPGPPGPSSTPGSPTPPGPPTPSTEFPWPNITVSTSDPGFPTLPPGMVDPETVVYRLPTDITPIKYRLFLRPDWQTKVCEGYVSIQLEVEVQTNLIVLHSKDLEIGGISILNMMTRMRIRIKKYYLRPEREMLFIELDELLYKERPYTLSIEYTARLDGLSGVYMSSYLDEQEKQKWIATSKFEPTYARQAFPCFDEPSMKATFIITVVRPTGDGYHALSNMNVDYEKVDGNVTEVTFVDSVPMSTYLACFIVSDFAYKAKNISGGFETARDFEMRVFATPAQVDKVEYALNTGAAITEFYIKYFNIAYPLPKLDMAAIPDFVSGAMEHWGLVTYRETALLYDKAVSSSANKQRVATVIGHELAHMWFGNLVTMKWWNDLWLNEGFASYIEYKGVHHVHPDWQIHDQFLLLDMNGVMNLDATLASHPIVQTVQSPSEITELFDTITYSKGASVIRMLENLIGEENFKNGTTAYLQKFFFSNADTNDYLSVLEELGFDYSLKLFMQTWTEQMGLPVVEVTEDGNNFKLTQKRFFANPEDYNRTYTDSQFNYHWSIPITYYTSESAEVKSVMFNYNDNEITIKLSAPVDWIKFNKNQFGYYRVNYPLPLWSKIISTLNNTRGVFSTADRANLISDVFALAGASQLDYSVALNLTTYLIQEKDYVPWSIASSRLLELKNLLYFTEVYRDYMLYARELVQQAYEFVTWNVEEDHLQNLLRVVVLNLACGFGHEPALQEAATRFNTWLSNPSVRPDPDIRSIVYNYGMQVNGNEKVWDAVWKLFVEEQNAQEKIKLMDALAFVKEPWILQRYINLAWNESYVRGQDYFSCLSSISSNRVGQPLVWDYVRENWERLVERFGINERYLGRLIPAITKRFTTTTKHEEIEAFFAKYPEAGAGKAARVEALETVKSNINWLKKNKAQVQNWLSKRQESEPEESNNTKNRILN